MTSFLPLLAVLILLSGVNYDSTTEFALVVVDGYFGCKKGMEDTRHQVIQLGVFVCRLYFNTQHAAHSCRFPRLDATFRRRR